MIHFTKDLYNFKKFNDNIDQLVRKHEIDEIQDEKEMVKLLARGRDVYCCLAPNELDDPDDRKNTLIWKEDKDELLDLYWTLTEEI